MRHTPQADLRVGDTAEMSRIVTERDIELFTEISGDRNPLHYDPVAAKASRFGEIVVQGGITSAILNAVVAEKVPGPGSVFLNLENEGPDGARGSTESLTVYASSTGADARERGLDQRAGSWIKLSDPAERLFLTAVGPGLPTFAAYQPYNQDVFSVHDSLVYPDGEPALPDGELSYLVTGWYSDSGDDILKQATVPPAY